MRDAASAQLHREEADWITRRNVISDGGNSDPFCVARLNSDGASKSCVNCGEVG